MIVFRLDSVPNHSSPPLCRGSGRSSILATGRDSGDRATRDQGDEDYLRQGTAEQDVGTIALPAREARRFSGVFVANLHRGHQEIDVLARERRGLGSADSSVKPFEGGVLNGFEILAAGRPGIRGAKTIFCQHERALQCPFSSICKHFLPTARCF